MWGGGEKRYRTSGVDDLVLMASISEEAIVEELRIRFDARLIYTYIGNVLLSVNPFQDLGIYGPEQVALYRGRYPYEVPPHVYALAERVYKQVQTTSKNQCILITGESGAGKTEASKKVMEYMAAVAPSRGDVERVKGQLLQSNPVLEAFGNAKTVRNNNSSRFGKYMEIQMDAGGTPLGGRVTNYLLEKSRVVAQASGERNFHIFYQLCAGATGELKEQMRLQPAEYYAILARSGCLTVKGMDDRADFSETSSAMAFVGMTGEEQWYMLSLVGAVLWLGNVQFAGGKGSVRASADSADALGMAAYLLGVDAGTLEAACVSRTINARGESIAAHLDATEAALTRDALAKSLYSRMFDRLVATINSRIYRPDGVDSTVGILDIYGLEIFEHNSFEQFCINFVNEKLQQLFIELTLRAEQEEYNREGIAWEHIDFFNNKIVCDLIESKRPPGILRLLDDECIVPEGNDRNFLRKMTRALGSHAHYGTPARSDSHFYVNHYAGQIIYEVDGFLDKNRDTLFRDLINLMASSASEFNRGLFPEAATPPSAKRPPTAGTQFKAQVQKLMNALSICSPHYIRCLKSNDAKTGGRYDVPLMTHQVRYLGLLENVRVRRAGFAHRQLFTEFVERYCLLSRKTWPRASGDARNDTYAILLDAGVAEGSYQFGHTKLFLREAMTLFTLEELRDRKFNDIAALIQRQWKLYKVRKAFLELKKKSLGIFAGRKRRRRSVHLIFLADYCNAGSNPIVRLLMQQNNDSKIVFADTVKMTKPAGFLGGAGLKTIERMLVITDRAFYRLEPKMPVEKTKLLRRTGYEAVAGLSLSTFADNVFVLHTTEKDYLFENGRKAEIATMVGQQYRETMGGAELNLAFADAATWRATKKSSMTVQWLEDPSLVGDAVDIARAPEDKTLVRIRVPSSCGSRAPFQLDADFSVVTRGKTKASSDRVYTGAMVAAPATFRAATHGTAAPLRAGAGAPAARAPAARAPAARAPAAAAARPAWGARPAGGGGAGVAPPRAAAPAPAAPAPPAPAAPAAPAAERRRMQYDFNQAGDDYLTCPAGSIITVVTKGDEGGWWVGSFDGRTGLFPSNYTVPA